jgi:NAD(P)-dependent dehydrogenase (short-subunit alcohol dehydrogenase family)
MARTHAATPIALVTGAGSGIGRATAVALARRGCVVVVADLDGDLAAGTLQQIDADGGRGEAVALDVTDTAAVDAAVAALVDLHGRLDLAHNNAGVFRSAASFVDTTDADFDRMVAVNLKGVWSCMRAELRVMVAQGAGAIVNTASAAGIIGTPRTPAYAASKHGVLGLTRSAAREYAPFGIRINAVCPGAVDTPMVTANLVEHPEVLDAIVRMQPGGRLAQPEEIAATVDWLLSDAASFVSGAGVLVTAGAVNR